MTLFKKTEPVNTDQSVRDYLITLGIDIKSVRVVTQIVNDELVFLEIDKNLSASDKTNITNKYPTVELVS